MSTHKYAPDELEHALRVIQSECRAHPEDCTECPLSFSSAALPTTFSRRENGTFRRHIAGRRSRMKQGGRIHDD